MSSINYYKKYIKYREKYIKLKKQFNMTGGAENKICLLKDINNLDINIIKEIEDIASVHRNNPNYLPYVFTISKFFSELKYSNSNEYDKIINNSKISYILNENKIIAFCRGVYKPYTNSVYINMVHVRESYRKQGLCVKVVDNLIKSYNGINYFNLVVLASNTPAIKCYEKLGFKLTNYIEGQKEHSYILLVSI